MSRPDRLAWVEAVWCSDLPPLQRLVCVVLADHATGHPPVARPSWDRLQRRTGMSRDALGRAVAGIRAAGWVEVDVGRGRRASRYVLVLRSSTADVLLSSTGDGPLRPEDGPRSGPSERRSSLPQRRSSTGDGLDHQTTLTTTMGPAAIEQSPGEQLAEVVVVGLPTGIGEQLTRSTLLHVCGRLAGGGMTPERLAGLVRRRSWAGAGPGLVIEVLTGWAERPPPVDARASVPACDVCAGTGWLPEDDAGRPVRCQCRRPSLKAVTA